MKQCIAHIRMDEGKNQIEQTAAQHCQNTAKYAENTLKDIHLGKAGALAGGIHDMGKFTERFEDYLRASVKGEAPKGRKVNHTFAAVRYLLEHYHSFPCQSMKDVACELLAYAAGAHHGLFDCMNADGKSGFEHRLQKEDIAFEEAVANYLSQCSSAQELGRQFDRAVAEIEVVKEKLNEMTKNHPTKADDLWEFQEGSFYMGLLTRLVLSAVIDADRRDTAEFMGELDLGETNVNWQEILARVEAKLQEFPIDSDINKARAWISKQCRDFAQKPGGIYRLSVPTGGGKTLSTLRYSLAHATQYHKKRIFFIIPLLSVIEQNAQVIREYVGEDALILEHHSNLIKEETAGDELNRQELLADNWRAPIVISTLVQLLNTFFSGKTTCIRRMSALVDSVLIIDEVQSVPRHMLTQFNLTLNFLSAICGTTIILCSATQPAFELAEHPLLLPEQPDMVVLEEECKKAFRRVEIKEIKKPHGYSVEELVQLAVDTLQSASSLLIICNTKGQAKHLFTKLSHVELAGKTVPCFHLSTAMCPKHRKDVLEEMEKHLAHREEKLICVSTQLIEAGVDISFSRVIRIAAGLDNVAQSSGRCNRNGEFGDVCPVYIVKWKGEDLGSLQEIADAKNALLTVMDRFQSEPERFESDLLSPAAITMYYDEFFKEKKGNGQNYPLQEKGVSLYQLLSDNSKWIGSRNKGVYSLNQAFHTAGKEFHVFHEDTIDVIVPYGKGNQIITELCSGRAKREYAYQKEILKKSNLYSISLFEYQRKILEGKEGLHWLDDGIAVLRPDFYNGETGLCLDDISFSGFLEV